MRSRCASEEATNGSHHSGYSGRRGEAANVDSPLRRPIHQRTFTLWLSLQVDHHFRSRSIPCRIFQVVDDEATLLLQAVREQLQAFVDEFGT